MENARAKESKKCGKNWQKVAEENKNRMKKMRQTKGRDEKAEMRDVLTKRDQSQKKDTRKIIPSHALIITDN